MLPVVLAARLAYAAGMMAGGVRWLRSRGARSASSAGGVVAGVRPRWE